MTEDARFEDGGESPLFLSAIDAEDLQVVSSLVQDAVFPVTEMKWDKTRRQFAILLNRFRWEDEKAAKARNRPVERVQSVFAFDDVLNVASQGVDRTDEEVILSILSVEFEPGDDGMGRMILHLAGDGAIAIDTEATNITLRDVTRPYIAPSRSVPHHD